MNILKTISKLLPVKTIYAHCDIPCGIYDPHQAQLAAHTVIRMTKMIQESAEDLAKVHRMMNVKEEHAEIVKNEVRIIWGDYFKEEHIEKFPNLHNLVFEIMKLASKTKQNVDPEAAGQLLAKVQEFAEIFYKSKNMEPLRIPSGYPTEGEVVSHK